MSVSRFLIDSTNVLPWKICWVTTKIAVLFALVRPPWTVWGITLATAIVAVQTCSGTQPCIHQKDACCWGRYVLSRQQGLVERFSANNNALWQVKILIMQYWTIGGKLRARCIMIVCGENEEDRTGRKKTMWSHTNKHTTALLYIR